MPSGTRVRKDHGLERVGFELYAYNAIVNELFTRQILDYTYAESEGRGGSTTTYILVEVAAQLPSIWLR